MTDLGRTSRQKNRRLLTDVVRDEIRGDLLSGAYSPGDKLPSEPELARAYNVSRITLREAVRGLVEEGYLSRRHGAGTYVTRKPKLRNNMDVNFGVTDLIKSMGFAPGNADVRVREEGATDSVARALALETGELVARLQRIRTADGDPIVFSVEFVPAVLLESGAEDLRDLPGSLYEFLAGIGHPVDHGVATIKPEVADRKMARKLGVQPGAPLLHVAQVDYGPGDRPVLYSLEWYRAEDLEVTVYRKGPTLQENSTPRSWTE
jgi:DNA-binding GntR family transcriptional regulator